MQAGNSINLAGAALSALGKNGSVLLSAGKNISLGTIKLQSEKDMTASEENYLRTKRGTELTTQIRANGNISITAGHDLTMRAADILSKNGNTSLFAGNDINLTAGRETAEDHYGIRYKERGLFSGKTTAIRIDTASDIARSTNITGRNVSITAKRDASFTAANIAADHDVSIFARRNIKAAAAENAHFAETYKAVKKSGVFSAGGLGFTIGKQETKTTHGGDALTQQGTSLAALAGNVALSAGERVHLTSANVQAGKEATVSAKEIRIDGKDNIYRERIVQESKTTGLTVSFGHGLIDLGQQLYAPMKRMGQVQDDRLKAAYALQTGRLMHDTFKENPLTGKTFSMNVSLGTSKSNSHMDNTTKEYAGSKIAAGTKAALTATAHDLTVKGSAVTGIYSRNSSISHGRRRQSDRNGSVRSAWRRLSLLPLLRKNLLHECQLRHKQIRQPHG